MIKRWVILVTLALVLTFGGGAAIVQEVTEPVAVEAYPGDQGWAPGWPYWAPNAGCWAGWYDWYSYWWHYEYVPYYWYYGWWTDQDFNNWFNWWWYPCWEAGY